MQEAQSRNYIVPIGFAIAVWVWILLLVVTAGAA